jgi:hypothetical protein
MHGGRLAVHPDGSVSTNNSVAKGGDMSKMIVVVRSHRNRITRSTIP